MTLTATSIEALARRALHAMADGSPADFEAVFHPEATNLEAIAEPPATRTRGPAAFHATALWLRAAYDELEFEVHEVVVDAERGLVVVHTTMSGRHTGPFVTYRPDGTVDHAFPPTGRRFAATQTHWLRVVDGLVIEHWANRDDLGSATQLGWIPPTPMFLLRSALLTRRSRRMEAAG